MGVNLKIVVDLFDLLDQRIERLVAKWTENYGYVFPTDPQPKAKTPESADAAPQDAAPHGAKKPKKEREDLFGKGE